MLPSTGLGEECSRAGQILLALAVGSSEQPTSISCCHRYHSRSTDRWLGPQRSHYNGYTVGTWIPVVVSGALSEASTESWHRRPGGIHWRLTQSTILQGPRCRWSLLGASLTEKRANSISHAHVWSLLPTGLPVTTSPAQLHSFLWTKEIL